jgi:hypothetical protein
VRAFIDTHRNTLWFEPICRVLQVAPVRPPPPHRAAARFKPRSLQTNAMDERFNGRISDALATHRFKSGKDQAETLERYLRSTTSI